MQRGEIIRRGDAGHWFRKVSVAKTIDAFTSDSSSTICLAAAAKGTDNLSIPAGGAAAPRRSGRSSGSRQRVEHHPLRFRWMCWATWRQLATRFHWLSTTPFGAPKLPEVKGSPPGVRSNGRGTAWASIGISAVQLSGGRWSCARRPPDDSPGLDFGTSRRAWPAERSAGRQYPFAPPPRSPPSRSARRGEVQHDRHPAMVVKAVEGDHHAHR